VLHCSAWKDKSADALKAILITYLRFGTGNPGAYRLILVRKLQGQDAGLPSEVIHAFIFRRSCVSRGIEAGQRRQGHSRFPKKMTRLLWRWQQSALGHWSTASPMLYIDGWDVLETAQND